MARGESADSICSRLEALDWQEIERGLWELGYGKTSAVLTLEECNELVALYDRDLLFRTTIHMERYRFGAGEYRYFAYPLPAIVRELRAHAFTYLAPIANRWAKALGESNRFPRNLETFLQTCHRNQQRKPTPLILRYVAGGYNCLHQDLYGDISFPLQLVCFLSKPGVDYGGGEFLLVEQRPRSQSRGEAIAAEQGEIVFFTNAVRPVAGRQGYYRVNVRHGASRILWGRRYALGIIFHDAR